MHMNMRLNYDKLKNKDKEGQAALAHSPSQSQQPVCAIKVR